MKGFITLSAFVYVVSASTLTTPTQWIQKMRNEEEQITQKVSELRAAVGKKAKSTQKVRAELAPLQKSLDNLGREIDLMSKQKFEQSESDQWKNVMQQAKSLQDFNQENLTDLATQTKKKK